MLAALLPRVAGAAPYLFAAGLFAGWSWFMEHRGVARERAAWTEREATIRASVAEEVARHNERLVEAMRATAADAAARAAAAAPIRRAIADAPPSHACAASPAIRAVTDGLRARAGGAPGAPAGAARSP